MQTPTNLRATKQTLAEADLRTPSPTRVTLHDDDYLALERQETKVQMFEDNVLESLEEL